MIARGALETELEHLVADDRDVERQERRDAQLVGDGGDVTDAVDHHHPRTGEHALLANVLRIAIEDLARPPRTAAERRIRDDAAAWVFGEDLGGFGFSFVTVCEHLGLEPERLRAQIAASLARPAVRKRIRPTATISGLARAA